MATPTVPPELNWLVELGVEPSELPNLNPCVPGEFTLPDTYYINTGAPRVIFYGSAEATLPLVAGRWYLIPVDIVARHPDLTRSAQPVAYAPRLIGA